MVYAKEDDTHPWQLRCTKLILIFGVTWYLISLLKPRQTVETMMFFSISNPNFCMAFLDTSFPQLPKSITSLHTLLPIVQVDWKILLHLQSSPSTFRGVKHALLTSNKGISFPIRISLLTSSMSLKSTSCSNSPALFSASSPDSMSELNLPSYVSTQLI